MRKQPAEGMRDIGHLPTPGTPERQQWDRTIRDANELYPDWATINVGKTRFRREVYEKRYKAYYEGNKDRFRPLKPL